MGMKTVLMKGVFNFTKEGVSQCKRNKMIDDFVYLRGIFVDFTNPLLETWNNEYTEPMNPLEDGLDPNYERFMISKFQPVADMVNALYGKRKSVRLGFDSACCDVVGIDKQDEERKITLTLEPYIN